MYKYIFKHQVAIWWSWERGSITIFTNLDCEGEKQGKKANKKDIKQEGSKGRPLGAKEKCIMELRLSRKIFESIFLSAFFTT
jgi:hypothetical protein